ncbi:MAG: hypothetical protein F6K32_15240 [Desertifilum sp. SIO1I2]|nr:hypothetical protein [Desertifilum sp. SIO1I2]
MNEDLDKMPAHDLHYDYRVGDRNFEATSLSEVSSTQSPLIEQPEPETSTPNVPLLIIPLSLLAIAWAIGLSKRLDFRKSVKGNFDTLKSYHKIPCSHCRFFKNDPHLKCAVHPLKVSNPEAVDCPDFWPIDSNKFHSNSNNSNTTR